MGASLALAGITACTRQPAGEDRPLRPPARRARPGQAAVLRDRDDARRRRHRPAGREPRRAADQDRRQPAASRQPRRHRRLRAGGDARPLRSRSLADADQHRRDPAVVGVPRRDPRGARRRSSRCRAPACASSPSRSARRRWPRRSATCSRAFRPRSWHQWDPASRDNARAGAQARVRRVRRRAVPASISADVILSLDADFLGGGPGSLRYARDFAARRRPEARRPDEPALRAREHADRHRRARRPSAAAQAERDRGGRARRSPRRPACRGGSGGAGGRRPPQQKWVARGRQGSAGASRREPRHRRRRPAAGGARARARDERRRSATSARRSSTPIRSRPRRSISCSRCAISSPT